MCYLLNVEPWWAKTITTIIGGSFVTAVFGFIKFYLPWRQGVKAEKLAVLQAQKKLKKEIDIIEERRKVGRIYNTLHSIYNNTVSDRVCVFQGHNCGGFPAAGKLYFVSAMYYVDSEGGQSDFSLAAYTDIQVDEEYNRMILEIYNRSHVLLKVSEMPKSNLKQYYEAEGVVESLVIYLGVKEDYLYYMSVAIHDGDDVSELSANEITAIVLKSQAIRNNII